ASLFGVAQLQVGGLPGSFPRINVAGRWCCATSYSMAGLGHNHRNRHILLLANCLESGVLPPDTDLYLQTAGSAVRGTAESPVGLPGVLPCLQRSQRRP